MGRFSRITFSLNSVIRTTHYKDHISSAEPMADSLLSLFLLYMNVINNYIIIIFLFTTLYRVVSISAKEYSTVPSSVWSLKVLEFDSYAV